MEHVETQTEAPEGPTKPDWDGYLELRPLEMLTIRRVEVTAAYISIILSDGSSLKGDLTPRPDGLLELRWKKFSNRGALTESRTREDGSEGIDLALFEGFASKQLTDAGLENIAAVVHHSQKVAARWTEALRATRGGDDKDALCWATIALDEGDVAANLAWKYTLQGRKNGATDDEEMLCPCGRPECAANQAVAEARKHGPAGLLRLLLGAL